MANRRVYQSVEDMPTFVRSVGAARAAEITITVRCPTCRVHRDVDLDRLIATKGPEFSLINRRPRCTLTAHCPGHVQFKHSGWGVMRPMETEPYTDWWSEREWEARQRIARSIREGPDVREEKKARERR